MTLKQVDLKIIDPDWIDKVEALEGVKATDKYGHTGNNSMIIITLNEEKLQQVKKSL